MNIMNELNKQDTSNTSQAMWIGIGSLFSFLFSIVSSAILSRYLTKGDYGTYKQVMYVYTTLLSIFTLGLPLAYSYFLPRVSLGEGKTLVNKLNLAFIVLGGVFSVVLFLCSDIIAEVLKNPSLGRNLRIFSFAPILMLPRMGLQGILATYRKTIWNAVYVISTRILMLLFVALPVVFYRANCETAIYGFIVSSFISCIIAMILKNLPFKGVAKKTCDVSYIDILKYSIPLMVAGLLGIFIRAADQFFVSRYYGQEVFADFANGSLELPFVSMVLNAGSAVLLPVFSRMISDNTPISTILELWERTAVKAAYILYPIIVFCFFFSTEIMTFLYGNMYESSSIYFRIMLVANFFTVIQFYPIVLALGKTKEYASVHIVILIMVWGLELLAVNYLQTPVAVTVVSVLCKILKMLLIIRIIAKTLNISVISLFPLKKLSETAITCAIAGIISYCMVHMLPSNKNLVALLIGFTVFAPVAFGLGYISKVDYLSVIRPITDKYFKKIK